MVLAWSPRKKASTPSSNLLTLMSRTTRDVLAPNNSPIAEAPAVPILLDVTDNSRKQLPCKAWANVMHPSGPIFDEPKLRLCKLWAARAKIAKPDSCRATRRNSNRVTGVCPTITQISNLRRGESIATEYAPQGWTKNQLMLQLHRETRLDR